MRMAKAAAAPAAAIREESLFWPRTAAPVVVAADEADDAAEETVDEEEEDAEEDAAVEEALAPVAVVEASVLVVAVAEPLRVVSDAVLLVAAVVEQETVLGRSVTPPRAQIDLAAWSVAAMKRKVWSANMLCTPREKTYPPAPAYCTCRRHSRQCCSGKSGSCKCKTHQCRSWREESLSRMISAIRDLSVDRP